VSLSPNKLKQITPHSNIMRSYIVKKWHTFRKNKEILIFYTKWKETFQIIVIKSAQCFFALSVDPIIHSKIR